MINHNNIVIVTGVSASGKDYLLSRTLQDVDCSEKISTYSFGSEIQDALSLQKMRLESRDSLRYVSAIDVRKIAREVIKKVIAADGIKILNTHVAYREQELIVADPMTDLEVQARDYIFVAADPEQIQARRSADRTRQRVMEPVDMISIHQQMAYAAVKAVASVTGAHVTLINNSVDHTVENVDRMREVITRDF